MGADEYASDSSGHEDHVDSAMPRRRTGGRSARVRGQVLAAAGELLMTVGYDGLTVDAVAERAGVHRTTVYRRWRDVGGLLADVLDAAADDTWSPPDTGSLEGDLTALNQEVYEALAGGGPSLTTALIAAGFRSAEAAGALARFWEDRYARCAVLVDRAAGRGELPGPADARALLVAATAPLYHELLLLRAAPDTALPRRAAAGAATAGRAGVYGVPGGRKGRLTDQAGAKGRGMRGGKESVAALQDPDEGGGAADGQGR